MLRSDAALVALPIHASYREDPSSQLTETVLASALDFVARQKPSGKARMASGAHRR